MIKSDKVNVCCSRFKVITCGDTEEHLHIGCDSKNDPGGNPIIDNEYAHKYCINWNFEDCPYYPK